MYIVAVIGRQFGKTTMAENLAIYWALNNKKSIVYWISPFNSQSYKVYEEILNAIIHTGCIHSNKGSGGLMEIEFTNGSKIQFRSAESENSLRGGSVDYMILDEAAFIKKSTFETILEPMLLVRGKKCVFISTPKGKNYLYELYLNGLTHKTKWISFRFKSKDSPLAKLDFLNEKKESMNEILYRQEYEADFVDSTALFNNLDDIMILDPLDTPLPNDIYYAGIDIGLINDASVLTIINSKGDAVKYYRWQNIKSPDLINEIININSRWNFKSMDIENNNQGLPIYHDLSTKLKNIHQVNTNQKTKPQMINRLVHLFNMKEMLLPKDEYLRLELQSFIFKQSETGSIKFMADSGSHDDCVMSLAIARNCYENSLKQVKWFVP